MAATSRRPIICICRSALRRRHAYVKSPRAPILLTIFAWLIGVCLVAAENRNRRVRKTQLLCRDSAAERNR